MTDTPLKNYKHRIESGELKSDPMQESAVKELQRLFDDLMVEASTPKPGFFARLAGANVAAETPSGVYMFGGVGRGKSMLMDLFYDCLPPSIKKRRVHFHEFMIEVHDYIHSRAADDSVKGMGFHFFTHIWAPVLS